MELAVVDTAGLLERLFGSLDEGAGGWIVTANLDILRRHFLDDEARALYDAADLRVADGMPLVWASRVQGAALPERVAGSSFTLAVAERAAAEGRSLYLLGGNPGAAKAAAARMRERWPELIVKGTSSPRVSSPVSSRELDDIVRELEAVGRADIVLVGLGSPKQEHLCRALRARFPRAWLIGVGVTFSFVAGEIERAPVWMQRSGLEWVHRLGQEPGRLAKRYLAEDLPFAFVLFGGALASRAARRGLAYLRDRPEDDDDPRC